MDQRDTFDGAADHYAAARPAYPAALFAELADLGALGPATRALEVGCGAGQATADLARRCASLLALDPGPNLIAQAQRRAAGLPVSFVVARFEDFASPPSTFDLIASAQAWHWIPAEIAFVKAAALLRPAGWLAIFGHTWPRIEGALARAMSPIYEEVLPGVWQRPHPSSAYLPSGPISGLFAASGLFEPAIHSAFDFDVEMSPEQFGRFLRTDSNYHVLPEAARFAFFDRLVDAVASTDGAYRARWATQLYAARRS